MKIFEILKRWINNKIKENKEKKEAYNQIYKDEELKEIKKKAKKDVKKKYNNNNQTTQNFTKSNINERIFGKNGGFL